VSRPLSWTLGFVAALGACAPAPDRGATVLYASGADLQSINPLLAVHPLARQVQRYVLLTTLARYDSALVPRPYLAREWSWSADRKTLRFRLVPGVRWHDGAPTTARDVRWTLDAARDPVIGYPRLTDLADLYSVSAPDDSTVVLGFSTPQARFPDVLTDLAILPAHLLDSVPRQALRRAEWNQRPVGNGPFRFVRHEPNRRWVFAANPDFPAALGGPAGLARLVLAVVDEPVTKLAALVDGELDFAGIQPAHAAYVRRDPRLQVLDYPLLFTYGLVFNTRRAPFDRVEVRRTISDALDRRELVEGYVYGYGTPATGPVPPDVAARPAGFRAAPLGDFELLTVGSGEGALEQMVQAQLARAGFRVAIRQLELSAFLDRLYGPAHDFDAAILGIPGDLGLGYLGPLAALAGMTAPRDPAAAERMFADSMPVAFLYHARGLQGMNRRVHGVRMDVRGELVTVHEWRVGP
jgi:peptide/nickel transport system substrate-binding protein